MGFFGGFWGGCTQKTHRVFWVCPGCLNPGRQHICAVCMVVDYLVYLLSVLPDHVAVSFHLYAVATTKLKASLHVLIASHLHVLYSVIWKQPINPWCSMLIVLCMKAEFSLVDLWRCLMLLMIGIFIDWSIVVLILARDAPIIYRYCYSAGTQSV